MKGFLSGYIIGALVMLIAAIITIQDFEKQPEIKPCNHISVQKLRYYIAKHELYMDSLNYGAKRHRSRYADSTVKFGEILRQND